MDRRSFLGVALPAAIPTAVLAVPLPETNKTKFGLHTQLRRIKDCGNLNSLLYTDSIYEIIGIITEQNEISTKISYRIKDENYDFVVRERDLSKFFEVVG